jgi:hypothetical protein
MSTKQNLFCTVDAIFLLLNIFNFDFHLTVLLLNICSYIFFMCKRKIGKKNIHVVIFCNYKITSYHMGRVGAV